MVRLLAAAALAAFISGCVDSNVAAPPRSGDLPLERLAEYTDFSGLRTSQRLVIRDAEQLAEFWAGAYSIASSAPPGVSVIHWPDIQNVSGSRLR